MFFSLFRGLTNLTCNFALKGHAQDFNDDSPGSDGEYNLEDWSFDLTDEQILELVQNVNSLTQLGVDVGTIFQDKVVNVRNGALAVIHEEGMARVLNDGVFFAEEQMGLVLENVER